MHYLTLGRWENADFAVFGNLFDCHGSLVTGHDVVPVVSNAGKRRFCTAGFAVGAEADSVEGRLRWAYWQTRSGGKYGFLYILDCGMSDETAQIAAGSPGNTAISRSAALRSWNSV